MCESQCSKNTHTYIHTYIQCACIHAKIHAYIHLHARLYKRMHLYINTFKTTKDIAAGQEIFIRYGDPGWFESKNLHYVDVDYASTMWRPDLQPLPCRQSVDETTGADGRHSFFVREAVPSGTVLEVSLCLEVAVRVIDQFPFLMDFVLTGETKNGHTGCQQTSAYSRAHTACVLQIKVKRILEKFLRRFLFPFSIHSQPMPKPALTQSLPWG